MNECKLSVEYGRMKNKYYFAVVPFFLGIGCFLAFNIIGSTIDSDGTLIEPFGLIPIGFLFIAISLIFAIIVSAIALFHNPLKFDIWVFGLSAGITALVSLYLFISISYLSERARIEILPTTPTRGMEP